MPRAVWLLGPVLALVLLPSNLVAAALPLLRTEWAATATEMGWVYAAYQVGYVGGVLVLLPLTDRLPSGRVILGCAVGAGLASLLFPLLAEGVWSAAALRALAGVGLAGVYLPGVRVVAGSTSAERRGLAVGVYVSAFYLGSALSLGATGALLPAIGWRGAAWALALASAAAAPLALVAAGEATVPAGRAARLRPEVLRQSAVRRLIVAYAAHSWELYVSRGWLAAYLAAILLAAGWSELEAVAEGGKWSAVLAACGVVGVWLGGWLSDRWGRAPAALGITVASGALSLVFGWLGGLGWAAVLLVGSVYGLLIAADSGIYSAAVVERAPADLVGSAQAAQASIGFLVSAIAPVAAGAILDLGGGFGGVFALAGVVGLAGAVSLVPLARAERPA